MGASAALCHIRHEAAAAPSEHGCFTLTAANVGGCGAVLCRQGRAVPLSLTHTVRDRAEYLRVRQHNAVVTEVTAQARRRPLPHPTPPQPSEASPSPPPG